MNTQVKDTASELSDWLLKQPHWLQYAAAELLAGKPVGKDEIIVYAKQAISEVEGKFAAQQPPLRLASLGARSGSAISLVSISKVEGVGQLKPRNPLNFGIEKIAVVFGSNGSGKSSYVRILKHACGARHKGEIYSNVFNGTDVPQRCVIGLRDDDGERNVEWSVASGVVAELSTVDIFDTHCGNSYLASEGQPTYEPRPLVFLSGLAALCDQVATKIAEAIATKVKSLPTLPSDYIATNAGKWYEALTARTEQDAGETYCIWNRSDEEELGELAKYLAERSPKDRAKESEAKKGFINGLVSSLKDHLEVFSDESCVAFMALRRTAIEKQQTAELAAKINLKVAVLDGVGTEQWLELWAIARSYSKEIAYTDHAFPHTGEDALCLLCQQQLAPEAKQRLQSFEQYVTNEAATAAKTAKEILLDAIERLPALPDDEALEAKAASAGLNEVAKKALKGFYDTLHARHALLVSENVVEEFGAYPSTAKWISEAQALAVSYEAQEKQFQEGFNEKERSDKAARQRELAARKWIHEQKNSVTTEILRLKQVAILNKAKELCSTRSISSKKGVLAEELITPAYVKAFNDELSLLGAKTVKVELVKTRVERGAALHQVRLLKAVLNKPVHEVLSEGEHRITCIAAFLADVASKPNGSTFVFDDPISSLDLDYEEAVVQRLVSLSSTRQVLIFTHRLSLLGMVRDYAKKADAEVRVINIRKVPWSAGEPGDESIELAAPKQVLNAHLPNRIKEAKAAFDEHGYVAYRPLAQSICTETRKLIERIIEMELLGDVIQRHRRAINTQGKLKKLADITPEDCTFLDSMMTKYSRYEHAQSLEASVELPLPEELLEDAENIKIWRNQLEQRRK
jgi:energy-coupling factor transporter ATP-binding protein EcfA2